jgi:hypothetical protein
MLRKLLKYDLRPLFRFWWIAALVTTVLAVIGGFCGRAFYRYEDLPWSVFLMLSMGSGLVHVSVALPILSLVLIFIRYYKNFFSDEGYLTFTLPVSRRTLMLSKIISGWLALGASTGVCLVNYIVKSCIENINLTPPPPEYPMEPIQNFEIFYGLIFLLEVIIGAALMLLCILLFLYACITFAYMIVRKGKLIAAIGISYGATSSLFTSVQLFLIMGISSLGSWLSPFSMVNRYGLIALMGLGFLLLLGMFCGIFYILQQLMLERKLNLS